jgi:hypothetical protein
MRSNGFAHASGHVAESTMEGVEVSALRDKHTKGYGLSGISWGSEHMCAYTAQPHMNISGVNRVVGEACGWDLHLRCHLGLCGGNSDKWKCVGGTDRDR